MRILVGQGSCGLAAGAGKISDYLEAQIKAQGLDASVEITGCIGTCYLEPIVDVIDDEGNKTTYVKVDEAIAEKIVESHIKNSVPVADAVIMQEDVLAQGKQIKIALKNCGIIDPESIDEYIEAGGYEAAKKCITQLSRKDVIEEIKKSGL